jgi:hypothetical protein
MVLSALFQPDFCVPLVVKAAGSFMIKFHMGRLSRFRSLGASARVRHLAVLKPRLALAFSAILSIAAATPAAADRIKHPIAVFSGLDKITGRIISFEVAANETVQFGSLQITERACYTRPPTEAPQTTTFLEVDEIDAANNFKRIFSGWMFASSPGLHALEHPVYDVWLVDCKGGTEIIPTSPDTASVDPAPPPPEQPAKPQQPAKPPKPKRVVPANDEVQSDAPAANGRNGPIEVGPPPGFDRRPPTQRYYPTTPAGPGQN